MRHLTILAGTLLLLSFLSYGLDPPMKLWEKWYYTNHDGCVISEDMEITDDGNLFITGLALRLHNRSMKALLAFLMDQDGNIIWEVEQPWYAGKGNDGIVLPDSSFIITGRCLKPLKVLLLVHDEDIPEAGRSNGPRSMIILRPRKKAIHHLPSRWRVCRLRKSIWNWITGGSGLATQNRCSR
jgi:hypothetical protein